MLGRVPFLGRFTLFGFAVVLSSCQVGNVADNSSSVEWEAGVDEVRRPVLVLVKQNPWLDVIGSDSPSFALYSDGLVIFRKSSMVQSGARFFSTVLSDEELVLLFDSLDIDSLFALEARYVATPGITDLPLHVLMAWRNGQRKKVSVYGMDSARTPESFRRIHEALTSYENSGGVPWLPEEVELMVYPFDYARSTVPWPDNWPDLDSPRATRRSEDFYSLYIDSSQYAAVEDLIQELGERTAVWMNERRWTVKYRLPFPSEESWKDWLVTE